MKAFMRILLFAMVTLVAIAAWADDPQGEAAGQMPEMGKPAQMDQVLKLVGTWEAELQMRFDTSSPYATAPCTMVFETGVDNCVLMSHITTTVMGMPYHGLGVLTYDREQKKWTQSYIDNITGSQAWSEGNMEGNTLTMVGSSVSMGIPFMTKDMTTVVSDTEINWSLDMSYDGGKTWGNTLKANYKKKM